MNTNTVEQAGKLKELGVDYKIQVKKSWISSKAKDKYFVEIKKQNDGVYNSGNRIGPALTLDELHRVFLLDSIVGAFQWPAPITKHEDNTNWWWVQYYNGNILKKFPRTKNHAQDWIAILIWLLENEHITAKQVNEALQA